MTDELLKRLHATSIGDDDAAAARAERALALLGALSTPDRIGPYRLMDLLGEGGMGTVFLAEQSEPIRREVALKLVKAGLGSREVLARFRSELTALSLMKHPHIAAVLDAGQLAGQTPYFVMEYVPGETLMQYCDRRSLDIESRLRISLDICDAVQHAHQRGIIHRDLKPSNVIVQEVDGEPFPKIIDFGIAKAAAGSWGDSDANTLAGQVLGTPEYMSPEQLEAPEDVDTRTDVHALGVLLYELLLGVLPYEGGTHASGSPLERIRRMQNATMSKPSTRITRLGTEEASAIASKRRTDIRSLRRSLRGDLDWIVMKALHRDRDQRYASVSDLRGDLMRYLMHEPVAAGPPSRVYRVRKFVRRHRMAVATLGALVILGSLGVVTIVREYDRAEQNAVRATANLAKYHLLGIDVRLDEAIESAKSIVPPWPERIDDLREWLQHHGEPLVNESERIERALEETRNRGRRAEPAAAITHRSLAEARRTKTLLEQELTSLGAESQLSSAENDVQRKRVRAALDVVNQAISTLTTASNADSLHFERSEDRFLFDALQSTFLELERFKSSRGTLAHMRSRLSWAEHVADYSIQRHRDRWEQARASLARKDSRCFVADLAPQMGLVPIGESRTTGLWEFYHLRSAADPTTVPTFGVDGGIEMTAEMGMVFVFLPGGDFAMGAQSSDPRAANFDRDAIASEQPVRSVSLDAFFISKYEMTQAQWKRMSGGDEPSLYSATNSLESLRIGPTNPVENVSWTWCDRILDASGLALPTEAQWEYACRACTTTPWSTGDDAASLETFANVWDQSGVALNPSVAGAADYIDGFAIHSPVGSFSPNGFGLYDMHGNVNEWCRDAAIDYGAHTRPGDGLRIGIDPGGARRVYRGGSFYGPAQLARSAARVANEQEVRISNLGVRPVRALRR
ncbi:MAG: SUMF1/EgtB/PvdO family nonheme iron enzyme [Planctomycetes bacterium]|nr:SUMF1/EgtB/PvdO family nonheme iron enzyme [Planctomycetota bacterium]